MRKIALLVALIALAASGCVHGQVVGNGGLGTTQGNDPNPCYNFSGLYKQSIGNGSGFPYSDAFMNPTALPITGLDAANAGTPGGTGMQATVGFDPCAGGNWVMVYTHAASSSSPYYPWVMTGTLQSSTSTSIQLASDTTNTGNQGHDAPSILDLPGNWAMIPYGAITTYRTQNPPAAWQDTDLGGASPSNARMPFFLGNAATNTGTGWANPSNKYFLPMIGHSEFAAACLSYLIGTACLSGGQDQVNTSGTYQMAVSGEWDALTYRITNYSGGACFDVVDRAATPSPTYTCAPNTTAATGQTWGTRDGTMRISQAPQDDEYFHVTFTNATNAATTGYSATINGCTVSNITLPQVNATGAQVATAVGNALQAGCPVTQFSYVPGMYNACTACVYVLYTSAIGINGLTAPPASSTTITGDTAPTNTTDYTSTGNHHFRWCGPWVIPALNEYALLCDIQLPPNGPNYAGHNSNALWLDLMLSPGPDATGHWTWTDAAGAHPYVTSPGTVPASLDGQGPGGTGSAGAPCQVPTGAANTFTSNYYCVRPPASYPSGMAPFCYDAGTANQLTCSGNSTSGATFNIPCMSQESMLYDTLSNSFVIACPSFSNQNNTGLGGVSVFFVSHANANTTAAYFIPVATANSPAKNVNYATQVIEDANGQLSVIIASGYGTQTTGCGTSLAGTCILRSRFNRATPGFAAPTVVVPTLGGTNSQGSTCQLLADPLERFAYGQCWPGFAPVGGSNGMSLRVIGP